MSCNTCLDIWFVQQLNDNLLGLGFHVQLSGLRYIYRNSLDIVDSYVMLEVDRIVSFTLTYMVLPLRYVHIVVVVNGLTVRLYLNMEYINCSV